MQSERLAGWLADWRSISGWVGRLFNLDTQVHVCLANGYTRSFMVLEGTTARIDPK